MTFAHRGMGAWVVVAVCLAGAAARGQVSTGLDVLEKENFQALQGRKVGIITNQTGLDRSGKHIVEVLTHAPGVTVVKLFSPEHGLYGVKDEKVGDMTDVKSGLPVVSLYGATRRPSDEMLKGIDTLVYDIQDVGARYYTYEATLGNCMEAAAKNHVRVVVLDRPNPVTGNLVDGPYQDEKYLKGFTSYVRGPVAHGMTVGELAQFYNGEYGIGAELQVVKMEGWRREMWWSDTGLPWTNPSPNMRNPTEALLYLAVGIMEATNISVGRGTDIPFECFGAPYADGRQLADYLNGRHLPGLYFTPTEFTPTNTPHKVHLGQTCKGVRVEVTDRDKVRPVEAGLTMAWALNHFYGKDYTFDKVQNLFMNKGVLEKVKGMGDPKGAGGLYANDVAKFKATREKYLLYK